MARDPDKRGLTAQYLGPWACATKPCDVRTFPGLLCGHGLICGWAYPRDSEAPELGFEPHNALLQAGSNGLDFYGFSQSSAIGAKPGRYPILATACFLEK